MVAYKHVHQTKLPQSITSSLNVLKVLLNSLIISMFNVMFIYRRIADGLENYIPNLETLILTGNLLQELADVDPLASLPNLTTLSLMHCPVAGKQHYRHYIAFKFPKLRLLDFRKIKLKVKISC